MFELLRHYRQRIQKGYSYRDVWDFRSYLAEMMPRAIRELKDKSMGCPEELYDKKAVNNECHKWEEVLEEIAQGFEATENLDCMKWVKVKGGCMEMKYDKKLSKLKREKFERGMDLFKKYYLNLWN